MAVKLSAYTTSVMNMKRLLILLVLLFVVACGGEADHGMDHSGHNMDDGAAMTDGEMDMDMDAMGMDVPDGLDLSTDKMSDNGTFHVTVEPMVDVVEINELHSWELSVMDMDMNPVEGATVAFGGGMPEHDHGFPTSPEVVSTDEAGKYLIEGVKMQMAGWWTMELDISAETMADTVTFNIVLP